MYTNVLAKALKRAFPNQRAPFSLIEDNDPTGYKSRAGVDSKKKAGITADSLPKRSPDLNVLDYALWNAINLRMRAQGSKYRKTKKETAREFKDRLRKTAMSLPVPVVKAAVGSMRRRCMTIAKLKGELFTE